VNRLQYKYDKGERLKKVYAMLASPGTKVSSRTDQHPGSENDKADLVAHRGVRAGALEAPWAEPRTLLSARPAAPSCHGG
jgi:hypothetical protein